MYKKICKKAGITAYHPHAFRHYSISEALKYVRTGLQLKALSQNVGHENPTAILEQYGNMSPNEYAEIINLMLANKGKTDLSQYTDEELVAELHARTLARTNGF